MRPAPPSEDGGAYRARARPPRVAGRDRVSTVRQL